MSAPLVSVVIPFRGRRGYLAEAVASVLAQTHPAVELVLVDDGSGDGSAEMASQLAPGAILVRQEPTGAGSARNAGLAAAGGDLLAMCDSDDLWEPGKLELQVAAMRADPGLGAVLTLAQEFLSPELDAASAPVRPVPGERVGAIPSALLATRETIERVGGFDDTRVGHWADWYIRLVDSGIRVGVVPHVLVRRRVHLTNLGRIARAEQNDYLRALKASLDRRRAAAVLPSWRSTRARSSFDGAVPHQ